MRLRTLLVAFFGVFVAASSVQAAFQLQITSATVPSSLSAQIVTIQLNLTYTAADLPKGLASASFGFAVTTPPTFQPVGLSAATTLIPGSSVSPTPNSTTPPDVTQIGVSGSQLTDIALSGTSTTIATFQFSVRAGTQAGIYNLSVVNPQLGDSNFNKITISNSPSGTITVTPTPEPGSAVALLGASVFALQRRRRA